MLRWYTIGVALLLTLVLGCTTTKLLDFTVISTRSIQLAGNPNFEVREKRVRGEDEASMVFVFPVGTLDVGEAIGRAIDSEPGCVALQDGSIVREERLFFPFLYADSKIVVEGSPIIDTSRTGGP